MRKSVSETSENKVSVHLFLLVNSNACAGGFKEAMGEKKKKMWTTLVA